MENPSFREALTRCQSSSSPVAWEAFYGPQMFTFGQGATLSTAPCLPISPDLTTPLVSGPDFGLPPTPFVPPLYEGVPDENLATLLITNVNEKIDGNVLLDQILCPPYHTENIDMNSNDTVLKNLKQLDVENSSSKGPSINSSDLKRKKKDDESRSS
ncbi:hypothetical protein Ancab_032727 [Ancistrocladus abbreviatus]